MGRCLTRLVEGTVGYAKKTRNGTLQKLNGSTVRWYSTVQDARYVVSKF